MNNDQYMKKQARVVPWFSKDEWYVVRDNVFSSSIQKKKMAVNHLLAWKARVLFKLPVAIDCTISLLQAQVTDEAESEHNDYSLRLTYSMAIVRFMNLITEGGQKGSYSTPVHKLAENLNLPDWVVDLRHEATHSTALPSLSELRAAANLGIEWLKNEYWQIQARGDDISVDWINSIQLECEILDILMDYHKLKLSSNFNDRIDDVLYIVEEILTESPDVFVSVFLRDSVFFCDQTQLQNIGCEDLLQSDNLDLPKELKDFWWCIIKKLGNICSVFHLFTFGLAQQIRYNSSRTLQAYMWLKEFTHEDLKSSINWISLLSQLIISPSKLSISLLNTILPLTTLNYAKATEIAQYVTEYVEKFSQDGVVFDCNEKARYDDKLLSFVQELSNEATHESENSENMKTWELASDVDWENVALGVCPGQSIGSQYEQLVLSFLDEEVDGKIQLRSEEYLGQLNEELDEAITMRQSPCSQTQSLCLF